MIRRRYIALLMPVLIFLAVPVRADGWTQRAGHGYYNVGFRFVRATAFYEPDGTRIPIPTMSDYVASFYGEHGLTDWLTVLAYIPFYERITLNRQVGETNGHVFFEGDAVNAPADAVVGARVSLLRNRPTVLSVSLKLGVPIGRTQQENGLLTGDGEMNQTVSLEAGHSFYPLPAYVVASGGYDNRLDGFSDQMVYRFEGGYTLGALTLVGRVHGIEPMRNGDDTVMGGTGGLYANNQRYLAYGAEVIYTTGGGVGFSVGAEGATRAQNVLDAPAFTLGISVSTR